MKKIIIASIMAMSSVSFGMVNMPSSSDFKNESEWSIAMASRACGVSVDSLVGAVGTSTDVEGGVVYTVTLNGALVAHALASNGSLFASKECLMD